MSAAINPDAGRDPVDLLVEQVELCLERPHDPVHLMDRISWAVAIQSEMPWHLPSVIEGAAVVMEQRYWCGRR